MQGNDKWASVRADLAADAEARAEAERVASQPKRRRKTGPPTAAERQAMADAVADHGTLTAAAEAVGVSRSTVERWAREDADLREALSEAREVAVDKAQTALLKSARSGNVPAQKELLAALRPLTFGRADERNAEVENPEETANRIARIQSLADRLTVNRLLEIPAIRKKFQRWSLDGTAPQPGAEQSRAFIDFLKSEDDE